MHNVIELGLLGVATGSMYALIAVSFGIIFNVTHIFHLAHGAVLVVGGYLVFALVSDAHLPALAGIVVACAATAAVGVAMEVLVYRVLRRRGASHGILFLASVGILIVLEGAVGLAFGPDVRTFHFLPSSPVKLGSFTIPLANAVMPAAWLLVLGTVVYVQRFRGGRLLRAIADSPTIANLLGADTNRGFVLSFALGSGLAVPAVVLYGWGQGISPAMGLSAILVGSAAVLLVGRRGLLAAALCALAIGLLQSEVVNFLSGSWADALVFGVIALAVAVRPEKLSLVRR